MKFLYLALAVLFNITANIGMKIAAQGGFHVTGSPGEFLKRNWPTLASLALYGVNALFYFLSLRHLSLSIVYPVIIATGFVAINLYAYFGLKEQITAWQIAGYVLVMVGIFFILLLGPKS